MKVSIDKTSVQASFAKFATKQMKQVIHEVQAEQLNQVATAFRESGQPGQPWKRLWADTFVGKIAWKLQGALLNAQSAFFRAMHTKHPDAMKIARAMNRVEKARAKAIPATSYRKGGEPLRDNGQLAASFFPKAKIVNENKGTSIIASSTFYAVYHQHGLKTKGPNFIPLTLKARRMHALGADPRKENLELGVDYIMAWKGVKVPARPMIDYANPTNRELIRRAAIVGSKR